MKSAVPSPNWCSTRPPWLHSRMRWRPLSAMYRRSRLTARPAGNRSGCGSSGCSSLPPRDGASGAPSQRSFKARSSSPGAPRPTRRCCSRPCASSRMTVGQAVTPKRRQPSQSASSSAGIDRPCLRSSFSAAPASRSKSKRGTCSTNGCRRPGLRDSHWPNSASRCMLQADAALTNSSATGRPRSSVRVQGAALSQVANSGRSWTGCAFMA